MAWLSGSTGLTVMAILIGLYLYASSATFENEVRNRVVAVLQDATGGRVEISTFHWRLLHLSFEATGITIHGTEASNEAPYAHIDKLKAQAGIFGLFTMGVTPRLVLNSVDVDAPSYHLIVYADGTTNQPHPRHKYTPKQPALDTLFDLRVGQLAVRNGSAQIGDQTLPLDFVVRDAALQLAWLPSSPVSPNSEGAYRIAFSLADLDFSQGPLAAKFKPMNGKLDGSAILARNAFQLDSLRLITLGQTLTLSGRLNDFAHPVWHGDASGQVDLRVLAPALSMPFLRSGILSIKGSVDGHGADYLMHGDISAGEVHYQDVVVDAHTCSVNADFRATPTQLLVSNVRVPLVQGGEVDGEFFYDNWLVNTPLPGSKELLEFRRTHTTPPTSTGRIRGSLKAVRLDTILDMLAVPQFRRLGLDANVSGPATADWTNLAADLHIGGQLAFTPSGQALAGEAPVQGEVDGMFHVESGSIQVAKLDVHSPHSSLAGSGALGIVPIDRASNMNVDLQSSDLSEFDAVLRALELKSANRIGSAALPAALNRKTPQGASLTGAMHFQGQLTSSWITPRVDGHLTGTNIGIEIPSPDPDPNAPPQFVFWDSLDADGVYTPATITVRHSLLRLGSATLALDGHVSSGDPSYNLTDTEPEFGSDSSLAVHAEAQQFPVEDLLPLAGISAPVTGQLTAKFNIQGPVQSLTGSGSVDVAHANLYGEPIDRVRASGSISGKQLTLASLTAERNAGSLTASGIYNLTTRAFSLDARGYAIDVGDLNQVKQSGLPVAGKLGFTLAGQGNPDDPRLITHATLSSAAIAGESIADLLLTASTQRRTVTYDLSSHQTAGELSAHGETTLTGDYPTQASLSFAKFDIGALLKLSHVTGITGQSDLEGTASISGPLAHPEKMNGEASLREFAVAIEGVHLASKGAVHATLAKGFARLDPLEVTGEETDLKLNGTLDMSGKRQLDMVANGSVNMKLAESLDPDLIASGVTSFSMEAHGPVADPVLQGKVEFQNAALALQDFPNGLSQIKGTLEFIQNRLEVRSLTALSGGGQLSVGGYIGFQHGLYADLTATGKSIRLRYPQGISSLADATLHLTGPQNNLQLGGSVVVTRFSVNSDLDITALATQASVVQPIIPPDAPSNHVHLDVHLTSAPQLNFQNAYAKLAGEVDLHLRGTIASPSLLGRISLTEGSTSIGGTRYELQRGDITFSNPVRIQPNIDLDATARVEDYDITLGLHGTTDKMNVSYRSEPPLPEADVIALLAQGHTQSEQPTYTQQQQQQAGDNPTTELLLGGALNATVSNRVQRLFGSGAVKVDPNFIGSIGNSTARVTVVEQIGNNLTFTFASNVNTTAQQLLQAEVAVNRHVSLLLTQDESGIFSVVLKIRRRFR
jgi:translocation and assembly module TamB